MQSKCQHISCKFPSYKPTTGYVYGCRCVRCWEGNTNYYKINNYKYKEKSKSYHKQWYKKNKVKIQKAGQLLKELVFINYGGIVCKCCGEICIDFLCLDHINNDGKQDRLIRGNGERFYKSLSKDKFPDKQKYQVLCFNCNSGKSVNGGICPHEEKTKIKVEAY